MDNTPLNLYSHSSVWCAGDLGFEETIVAEQAQTLAGPYQIGNT